MILRAQTNIVQIYKLEYKFHSLSYQQTPLVYFCMYDYIGTGGQLKDVPLPVQLFASPCFVRA